MSDSRPDQPPPRVEVRLPDGRTVAGRIQGWRQGTDGTWWAQVTIQVPASAVQQVDGEDYAGVPRHPAGLRYVLTADTRTLAGQQPTAVLHRADCWFIAKPAVWTRVTPLDDGDQARALLRFDDTTACDICTPAP